MPQNLFEPRRPVSRERPAGFAPGLQPPGDSAIPQQAGRAPEEPAAAPPPKASPPPAPPPVAEPSWVRVYWNTLRSFVRRRLGLGPRLPQTLRPRQSDERRRSVRRPLLISLAVAVILGLVGAGVGAVASMNGGRHRTGTATTRVGGPLGTGDGAPTGVPSPAVRTQVAQWIIANVGAGHLVACDAALCGTLSALGFPNSSLVPVQDSAQALQNADVAVVTATLRARLGAGLATVTGTEPLAQFGTGVQAVTVQAVAHTGRAAYDQQLAADAAARKDAGAALLTNHRITFSAQARAQVRGGMADLRVCTVLAVLSAGHTLTVSSFGPYTPGAGTEVPLSALEITAIDHRPATGGSTQARALRTLIDAQQSPYRPMTVTSVPAAPGSAAGLLLQYSQPAPLAAAQ